MVLNEETLEISTKVPIKKECGDGPLLLSLVAGVHYY